MAKLSTYALAGALAFALAPVAGHAADLPEPPLLEPVAPVEFGSAWYLRGDVGYKIYRNPKVSYGGTGYRHEDLDDTGVIGGGVGYKINEWARVDATVDYEFKSDFHGKLICPTTACGTLANPYSSEKAKVSAITPLLNVYADLGTWHGFTPYIGAGAGASYIMIDDYKYANPNGGTGKNRGGNDWSFSWALMAGVGYQVSDNVIIDAGYRYLNLGDGKTKKTNGGFNGSKSIKFDDLQAHEFRVGVRYLID
ncbi:MAG TPA: outer membrane protein [Hansschlegelia sp.]